MNGNYFANNRINFPVATPIALPESLPETMLESMPELQIDPAALENLAKLKNMSEVIPEINLFPRRYVPNLKQGCYQISYKPNNSQTHFHGTLRVDRGEDQVAISGDLYKHFRHFNWCAGIKPATKFSLVQSRLLNIERLQGIAGLALNTVSGIPIYARNRYYSYLKVTQMRTRRSTCELRLTIEEHVYDSATESFSLDRTVEAVLVKQPGSSHKYIGSLQSASGGASGAILGEFSITWVSRYFRTAKLEIDAIEGAAAPQSITANGQVHSFRSIFKTAGWDLKVKYDEHHIPNTYTGGSVNWTTGQMHQAMLDTRRASANLDSEWLLHLLVVPEEMGSGRGIMYDQIGANREGVASFSNDGYPAPNSNWGAAEGLLQHDVPQAFLRSACHEVGHGFNMIHQSATGAGEPGSDATVMTTSPSVASFVTANGGTFPDDIEFRFNDHVRHHLVHFPDMIVRPGGASWAAGHSTTVPEADQDRYWYESDELQLAIESEQHNVKLGEPLNLKLKLQNNAGYSITVPECISPEYLYSRITVIDSAGERTMMPAFVMKADSADLCDLKADEAIDAEIVVFWSSKGFAFKQAGKHTIEMQTLWNIDGVPFGVSATSEVWVDAPVSNADNDVASLLLDDEVGIWTMLGGAGHLDQANSRVAAAIKAHPKHAACTQMAKLVQKQASHKTGEKGKPREVA